MLSWQTSHYLDSSKRHSNLDMRALHWVVLGLAGWNRSRLRLWRTTALMILPFARFWTYRSLAPTLQTYWAWLDLLKVPACCWAETRILSRNGHCQSSSQSSIRIIVFPSLSPSYYRLDSIWDSSALRSGSMTRSHLKRVGPFLVSSTTIQSHTSHLPST